MEELTCPRKVIRFEQRFGREQQNVQVGFFSESVVRSPIGFTAARPASAVLLALAAVVGEAVFVSASTSISQLGSDIDGEAAYDSSGYSVSLSSDGTEVAIGAYANDGNGADSGHVRVYEWNGTAWVQKGGDIMKSIAPTFWAT